MITQDYLKLRLIYEPESGIFTWRPKSEASKSDSYWNRMHVGEEAGSKTSNGYIRIKIDRVEYPAHRLAWIYTHGEIPADNEIDHKDRIRTNNRIANLRLATRQQNARNKRIPPNNTSGVLGVTWNKRCQKWQASIEINGVGKYLGIHSAIEDAMAARFTAQSIYFGEWAGETP